MRSVHVKRNLLDAVHDWSGAMESGSSVHIAFLDFAKAFGTVSRDLLHEELKRFCFGDRNLRWITNFLENREQRVILNGEFSKCSAVKSGVPRGTIIGPVPFNCSINNITDGVQSTVRLYADDCIVYRSVAIVANLALSFACRCSCKCSYQDSPRGG